ncbi:MAG: hypothetical protein NTW29_20770 [Bacteroidetes bacterium]|nr:hypothetical protein [Bacteroidota bacterium]
MAAIVNYLIGIGLMITCLLILKNKDSQTPGMKIYGLKFKTIAAIIYVAIAIDAILIIGILAGFINP